MSAQKSRVQQALDVLDTFADEVSAAGLGGEFDADLATARDALKRLESKVEQSRSEGSSQFYYEVTPV